MPFAETAGARIYYTDTGGDLPTILFMHGFLLDTRFFEHQVAELSSEYRVLCLDARGHGLTEDFGNEFSFWDQAEDVRAVMDAAEVKTAVLAGMSQGGFTALRIALTAPEMVSGLILIGTDGAEYTERQKAGYRFVFDRWVSDPVVDDLMLTLASSMIGGTRDQQQVWIDRWREDDRTRLAGAVDCLIRRDSVETAITAITCPSLIIRGSYDQAFSDAAVRALRDQLGGETQLETIEAPLASHAVSWTHPEIVNPLIRVWLKAISG
ncbi:alpha/beta fold hydrolase [Rhodococcus spongiicola]|uniref:Alpha/beta hydrolase n=1 Tax=Rhodococcus spongiicola TaxID=2487352 RepID=A0A3S3E661_9NOCA|nr:alpha/beta hydrolase [Rhodococcus spongiicola]RVW06257.1 alpha/beta hydrolase [Rhodococcus spongiicola]